MRSYDGAHQHWCGIDLHARTMYVCILDSHGEPLVHRNPKATPEAFLEVVAPYREGLVVAVECIYTWYWLADLCAREDIPFVLGHALYMKAIHGGKAARLGRRARASAGARQGRCGDRERAGAHRLGGRRARKRLPLSTRDSRRLTPIPPERDRDVRT